MLIAVMRQTPGTCGSITADSMVVFDSFKVFKLAQVLTGFALGNKAFGFRGGGLAEAAGWF